MKSRWVLFFLLLLVLIIHRNAFHNGFYWDDRPLIVEGKRVQNWSDLPDLFTHELWYNVDLGKRAPSVRVDTYRPMLTASFLIDRKIWGEAPLGYHMTNLLIHIANTVLLFALLSLYIPEGVAFGSAALFALHPMTTECIQYISARSDSLAIFFVLLALWLGLHKSEVTWKSAVGMGLSFLFGVFVKETALIFPVVWAASSAFRSPSKRTWIRSLMTIGGSLLLYATLRLNALRSPKVVYDKTQLIEQFLGFSRWVGQFFFSIFSTTNNMPMQEFARTRAPGTALDWICAILFISSFFGLIYLFSKRRWKILIPILWIVLTLVPPFFATSLTEVLNPRYLYAPLMGASVLVVLAIARCGRQIGGIALAVLVGILTLRTAQTAPRYRSEEIFYREILRDQPHHVEAEYNLANVLAREERYAEAIDRYQEILLHEPHHRSALNNLGLRWLQVGNAVEAERMLALLNTLPPKEARYEYNWALVLLATGQKKKAVEQLHLAIALDATYQPAKDKLREIESR